MKPITSAAMALVLLSVASCEDPQAALNSRLLEIARGYQSYGRVDYMNRWAPTLCASFPSEGRISGSGDEETHGRKLYYVFARNRDAYYEDAGKKPQPAGQVIVKESWLPREVASAQPGRGDERSDPGGPYVAYAEKDGHFYTTGPKGPLFIMMKEGSEWVYGTTTPSGDRVLEAGRIASCLDCHQKAKPDSVFGLPAIH